MKVAFAIAALNGGGAQRTTVNMANYWAARGWDISIFTFASVPSAYPLDPRVEHRVLAAGDEDDAADALRDFSFITRDALASEVPRIAALRTAMRGYDAVIAMIDWTNVRAIVAAHGTGVPVFASEQISAGRVPFEDARRETYRCAAAVIAQTTEDLAYFERYCLRRGAAIPNFVGAANPRRSGGRRPPLLMSLGRLTYQKGYDLLLDAFARVAPSDWRLEIWGEGPLRFEAPRVTFPGFTHDAATTLARADLYVQPSRAEGFPNALCEAMACGLPVIASDCAPGVRAIVRDGIDGLLVRPNSVTALSAALARLMNDRDERLRFGARAKEIVTRFPIDDVMHQWETLLGA